MKSAAEQPFSIVMLMGKHVVLFATAQICATAAVQLITPRLPTDCSDVSDLDRLYTIYPAGSTSPVQVYCDMSKEDIDSSAERWRARMEEQPAAHHSLSKPQPHISRLKQYYLHPHLGVSYRN